VCRVLARCHTCNFIARFCRAINATLSRDKIASVTWLVAQLLNSRATLFSIRAALYSVQLCREKAVNADWSILVYATKLQFETRHVTLAILSRDKVARPKSRDKIAGVTSVLLTSSACYGLPPELTCSGHATSLNFGK